MNRMATITFKFMDVRLGGWDAMIGFLTSAALWCFGSLAPTTGIVMLFAFFDFLTGLIKALKAGKVASARIMDTVYKMVGYAIILSMMHILFNKYIPASGPEGTCLIPDALLDGLKIIPFGIASLMILREAASITENLAEAGILPATLAEKLSKVFLILKDTLETNKNGGDVSYAQKEEEGQSLDPARRYQGGQADGEGEVRRHVPR